MYKIIYSQRIAKELIRRGFKVVDVQINIYKPELNCFLFEETEELNEAFGEIVRGNKDGSSM